MTNLLIAAGWITVAAVYAPLVVAAMVALYTARAVA